MVYEKVAQGAFGVERPGLGQRRPHEDGRFARRVGVRCGDRGLGRKMRGEGAVAVAVGDEEAFKAVAIREALECFLGFVRLGRQKLCEFLQILLDGVKASLQELRVFAGERLQVAGSALPHALLHALDEERTGDQQEKAEKQDDEFDISLMGHDKVFHIKPASFYTVT